MKKQFLALIAAGSLLAACNGGTASKESGSDSAKQQPQALMGASAADGEGEAPQSGASAAHSSSFVVKDDAQAMISSYNANPLSSFSTKYYLADAYQLKAYLDYAVQHDIKDVQLVLARNEDQVTIVITGVKPDGTHVLYPDPNNSNIPSVIENCLPCPPGTDCYTSTNLSQ